MVQLQQSNGATVQESNEIIQVACVRLYALNVLGPNSSLLLDTPHRLARGKKQVNNIHLYNEIIVTLNASFILVMLNTSFSLRSRSVSRLRGCALLRKVYIIEK